MRRVLAALTAVVVGLSGPVAPLGAADFSVVGGRPAAPDELPAVAALVVRDEAFQFCGGTLIAPTWVLTAAHCFHDSRTGGSRLPPDALEVVVGTTRWTEGGERLGVSEIRLHPDYDPLQTINDLALLRLSTPASTIPQPLVPPDRSDLYAPGRSALVAGFGATRPDGSGQSEDLLLAEVPLVGDDACGEHYELAGDRHTCAGDPGPDADHPGPDSCQGDSGGPLLTDRGDGDMVQIGITSFGRLCGVAVPGVYTEVVTYLRWIAGVLDGTFGPGQDTDPTIDPLPGQAGPHRIVAAGATTSEPAAQAAAISAETFFEGGAAYGVVATVGGFADALGGSSLAFGEAPLLFAEPGGLGVTTVAELQRAVRRGAQVYVLGGTAAVPPRVDQQLREAGFTPVRLAGATREATAVAIADELIARVPIRTPDLAIVATRASWPDAVTAGQIGARHGAPILLTSADALHPDTAAALVRHQPSQVVVVGGSAVIADAVTDEIEAITGPGTVLRLGGATRFETARAVSDHVRESLLGEALPGVVVPVNLRRTRDGYAHALAASMLAGRHGGIYVPVEGEDGDHVPAAGLAAICALDVPVLVPGAEDLIGAAAVDQVVAALSGVGCDASLDMVLGQLRRGSISSALPQRRYRFQGTAGQRIRIRMDAVGAEGNLDPAIALIGPGGSSTDNDDGGEGLNALLETTLPSDGEYWIVAAGFRDTAGSFVLSLDPAPEYADDGVLLEGEERLIRATPPPGTVVLVEVRSDEGGLDPLAYAVDQYGREIAFDDDGGGNGHTRLRFVMPGDGAVVVHVAPFPGTAGPYRLAIMELPQASQ